MRQQPPEPAVLRGGHRRLQTGGAEPGPGCCVPRVLISPQHLGSGSLRVGLGHPAAVGDKGTGPGCGCCGGREGLQPVVLFRITLFKMI